MRTWGHLPPLLASSFSWTEIRQQEDFCHVKDIWRRKRLMLQLPLWFMTFALCLTSGADICLHISCQRSNHGGGDSCQAVCVLYIWAARQPSEPHLEDPAEQRALWLLPGGSGWKVGQMRGMMSVTGTVSCNTQGSVSNISTFPNCPKFVRIWVTIWKL